MSNIEVGISQAKKTLYLSKADPEEVAKVA
jgi:hypothetical protein